jgi:CBS domain-containing protein
MSIQEKVKVVEVIAIRPEPPVVVDVASSVRTVIERMREARTGYALVTRDDRLAGIFTERDLIAKVLGHATRLDESVAEVMTCDPTTVADDESIRQAVEKMQKGGFRNIPIVDKSGRVVGCVGHKDIIAYLVETFADRTLNLPPDPDQIAKTPDGA